MSDTTDTEYDSISSVEDYINSDSNNSEASGDYATMATALSVTFEHFKPEFETVPEFLERFKVQCSDLLEKAGTNDKKKAAVLIKTLPVPVVSDLSRRLSPKSLSDATYDEVESKLRNQYEVKKSIIGASVQLFSRKQQASESIEEFAKTLNNFASPAKYGNCCRDRIIRDCFVSGLYSSRIISSLLHECEDKSFDDCVERAKTLETFASDAQNMKQDTSRHSAVHSTSEVNAVHSPSKKPPTKLSQNYVCIRCSARNSHLAKDCYALKLSCRKCNKIGHIAVACKSNKSSKNVHHVEHADSSAPHSANGSPPLSTFSAPDARTNMSSCPHNCCSFPATNSNNVSQCKPQENSFDSFLA